MSAVTVERWKASDSAELFSSYAEVFGNEMAERSRARWSWQYFDNPAAEPEGPAIWIAREGKTILGQYASMPVRLFWDGREVRASWGMDVFVRTEARGKGVGAQLFSAWADHVDVALGLGLTSSSYGLFRKLGFRDVGPVPFYQKVLDARAVAVRRFGRSAGAMIAPALRLGLKLLHPERSLHDTRTVDVRRIASFGAEHDALWERTQESYAMCVRRDARYLEWKYVRCPRKYDLWEARQAGGLLGWAVTRIDDYRGARLGWIVDAFADRADTRAFDALLAAAVDDFRKSGVVRAQAFAMNGALQSALRRRGFFAGRSPMQFCVHARADMQSAFNALDRWHVVFGDSDMDR